MVKLDGYKNGDVFLGFSTLAAAAADDPAEDDLLVETQFIIPQRQLVSAFSQLAGDDVVGKSLICKAVGWHKKGWLVQLDGLRQDLECWSYSGESSFKFKCLWNKYGKYFCCEGTTIGEYLQDTEAMADISGKLLTAPTAAAWIMLAAKFES